MTPLLAQRPRPDRAFERMYRRHVGDVYRYALAVMRNPADAEDVTQTTFLNAYRSYVEKGNRPEKPQNWLIAIAHNVCRQRFRQSARRPAEVSFEDDIADTIADEDTPSGEDIRRALGHLAFNQRAALVMRELEGRSYAEIAEILDLSTSAVETLIFRARRAPREQLETSLTCGEAELAISRQLDGRLGRPEKGALRAHLRQCKECASFARRQRAQRSALRSLGAVPVPASLSSFFGGGAAVGTGLAVKAAVAVTVGAVVGSSAYVGVRHTPWHARKAESATVVPVFRSVAPGAGIVPAPREHTPPIQSNSASSVNGRGGASATHGHGQAHGNAAAHGRGQARGRGHGHGKPAYHGDASIAARHEHVQPARSGQAASSHPTHPSHPAPHAKPQVPGPYDAGPPPGAGNGKKSGK